MTAQNPNELIAHSVDGAVIHQRVHDGYFNATAMCTAAGKLFGHYRENKQTAAFLAELERSEVAPVVRTVFPLR